MIEEGTILWEPSESFKDKTNIAAYMEWLKNKEMPGAEWFSGSTLNYVEHIMRQGEAGKTAIFHDAEVRGYGEMNWDTFKLEVVRLATTLREMGVKPGDRVAAYLPNIPETVVAMMASMSIGAVWSSCSPDFG